MISTSGGSRNTFSVSDAQFVDPLVSVITVVRNGETTIARCIESVLAQTYKKIEHIIIDGCSTDKTVSILRHYGTKIDLWISEPDSGIYNALNKGIKLARGTHYIPLGCDDVLVPTGVESLMRYRNDRPVISGQVRFVDINNKFRKLVYNHSAGTLICISLHLKFGLYDESYRISADTKFLQLTRNASLEKKIFEIVGEFTVGGASSNYPLTIREHSRAMLESGSWGPIRAFLWLVPRQLWVMFGR
jgi:glycosyltransferase involved in cell wall biosynthesis